MKIGIAALGYQVQQHLDSVLNPWIEIKENPQKFGLEACYISACHALFPEYYELGKPIKSTDGCIESLQKLKDENKIDFLHIAEEPLKEHVARNKSLPFLLEKKVDLLWLLDLADEIYSIENIKNILNFIRHNELVDYFSICFKNYIDKNKYVDNFQAPRIWKVNSASWIGQLEGFYWDNNIYYSSGARQEMLSHLVIPSYVAWIKHYSWFNNPISIKEKILFQNKHYNSCSYKWNEEKQCVDINLDYYQKINKPVPQIYLEYINK